MKILLVGSFVGNSLEGIYFRELSRVRKFIFKFDTSRYRLNFSSRLINSVLEVIRHQTFLNHLFRDLSDFIKNLKPDIIIIFKGMEFSDEYIFDLKSKCSLLVNYNPDHPYTFFSKGSGNRNILNSIQNFDIYLTYSIEIAKGLEEKFRVNSHVVPFGFYYDTFPNINFALKNCISFLGAYDAERAELMKCICAAKYDLAIFGDKRWLLKFVNSYRGTINNFEDLYSVYFSSKLSINLLRPQNLIHQSHNMRTFEVPGVGGVLLSDYTLEQDSFFEEGKEALYFRGKSDLMEKLPSILSDSFLLERIRLNGLKRSKNSGYHYSFRVKEMLSIFNQH